MYKNKKLLWYCQQNKMKIVCIKSFFDTTKLIISLDDLFFTVVSYEKNIEHLHYNGLVGVYPDYEMFVGNYDGYKMEYYLASEKLNKEIIEFAKKKFRKLHLMPDDMDTFCLDKDSELFESLNRE